MAFVGNLLELVLRQVSSVYCGKQAQKSESPQPFWKTEKLTLSFKDELREVRAGGIKEIELSDKITLLDKRSRTEAT